MDWSVLGSKLIDHHVLYFYFAFSRVIMLLISSGSHGSTNIQFSFACFMFVNKFLICVILFGYLLGYIFANIFKVITETGCNNFRVTGFRSIDYKTVIWFGTATLYSYEGSVKFIFSMSGMFIIFFLSILI